MQDYSLLTGPKQLFPPGVILGYILREGALVPGGEKPRCILRFRLFDSGLVLPVLSILNPLTTQTQTKLLTQQPATLTSEIPGTTRSTSQHPNDGPP